MLHDNELRAFFTRSVEADVAEALILKFRTAEQAKGMSLPKGYAAIMVRNHLIDVERRARIAERAAARAVVEQAERIEADNRADDFVAAALQFEALTTLDVVRRMTPKQQESVAMLRAAVIDGALFPEVAARHGLTPNAAYQRISRLRTALRPVATALGFTALLAVAIDNRISPNGGAVDYK